jgi:hypothetical protein
MLIALRDRCGGAPPGSRRRLERGLQAARRSRKDLGDDGWQISRIPLYFHAYHQHQQDQPPRGSGIAIQGGVLSRVSNRGQTTDLDRARDELFSHIHRCGVLRATAEQQAEWMDDTMEYMGERYPALSAEGLAELRAIGLRFCQPVINPGEGTEPATETEESSGPGAAAA